MLPYNFLLEILLWSTITVEREKTDFFFCSSMIPIQCFMKYYMNQISKKYYFIKINFNVSNLCDKDNNHCADSNFSFFPFYCIRNISGEDKRKRQNNIEKLADGTLSFDVATCHCFSFFSCSQSDLYIFVQ